MTDETFNRIKEFTKRYTIAPHLFGGLGSADLVVSSEVDIDNPEMTLSPPHGPPSSRRLQGPAGTNSSASVYK